MSKHFVFQAVTIGVMAGVVLASPRLLAAAPRSECYICVPPPIFECEVTDYDGACRSECGTANPLRECIYDFAGCSPSEVAVICE